MAYMSTVDSEKIEVWNLIVYRFMWSSSAMSFSRAVIRLNWLGTIPEYWLRLEVGVKWRSCKHENSVHGGFDVFDRILKYIALKIYKRTSGAAFTTIRIIFITYIFPYTPYISPVTT